MSNHIKHIDLSCSERKKLEKIVRKTTSPQGLVLRAKIILMTADDYTVKQISKRLNTTRATIRKWKSRYIKHGLTGLNDSTRPGHPCKYNLKIRQRITREAKNPPSGLDHWNIRTLAAYLGINRGIVQRVLQQQAIKLH